MRFHGQGGQGVVTLATWVARAAYMCGREVQAFPFYGAERRGAPVKAFARVSDETIYLRSQIYTPDLIVVFSRELIEPAVAEGIKEGGGILMNGGEELARRVALQLKREIHFIDATSIALEAGLEIEGMPMVNIPLLGAVIRQSKVAGPQEVAKIVGRGGKSDGNVEVALRGFEETRVVSCEVPVSE